MSTNDMTTTYAAGGLIVNTLALAVFRAVGVLVVAVTAKLESGRAVAGTTGVWPPQEHSPCEAR
jgi:hypothetical protein